MKVKIQVTGTAMREAGKMKSAYRRAPRSHNRAAVSSEDGTAEAPFHIAQEQHRRFTCIYFPVHPPAVSLEDKLGAQPPGRT